MPITTFKVNLPPLAEVALIQFLQPWDAKVFLEKKNLLFSNTRFYHPILGGPKGEVKVRHPDDANPNPQLELFAVYDDWVDDWAAGVVAPSLYLFLESVLCRIKQLDAEAEESRAASPPLAQPPSPIFSEHTVDTVDEYATEPEFEVGL